MPGLILEKELGGDIIFHVETSGLGERSHYEPEMYKKIKIRFLPLGERLGMNM